jgi:hypothetical protein
MDQLAKIDSEFDIFGCIENPDLLKKRAPENSLRGSSNSNFQVIRRFEPGS